MNDGAYKRDNDANDDNDVDAADDDKKPSLKNSCFNRPIEESESHFAWYQSTRAKLARVVFSTGIAPVVELTAPTKGGATGEPQYLVPYDAYKIAFLRVPDAWLQGAIARLLANELRKLGKVATGELVDVDEEGHIYVYHNMDDEANVVKIGRTQQTVERRRRQWERDLAPQPGQQLVIYFSAKTRYNRLAEAIIHEMLTCERLQTRFNDISGRRLIEYFRVPNIMALKLFIALCVAYADAWGATARASLRTGTVI